MEIKSFQFEKNTKAAPLAVFRIFFGLIMCISMIRFWYHGWIEKLYLLPSFHFKYTGFEFVEVPGQLTYLLFVLCGLSALFVSIGYKYRLFIVLFFLSFTYIELMDKTTYLNHYYFISIVSFILIWLPAHCYFSVDAVQDEKLRAQFIPRWNIDVLKLMIGIVYVYAGFAKLNYDWMCNAMPLSIWLPTKFEVPFLGSMMHEKWVHYFFSWGGAVYDLSIVFLLLWRRTRVFAFLMVLFFHILTRVLFPIGMFPYIMIAGSILFFGATFHEQLLTYIAKLFQSKLTLFDNGKPYARSSLDYIGKRILIAFMLFQLLFPLRNLLYSGNLFWNERGYRFSWRVMLMEKTGYANFKIVDGKTGKRFYVQNDDFLSSFQEKQMSTQPDFILEYGQYLGRHFAGQGHKNVAVYVESYAALNGRKSQVYIDPQVDLMTLNYTQLCNAHISSLNE